MPLIWLYLPGNTECLDMVLLGSVLELPALCRAVSRLWGWSQCRLAELAGKGIHLSSTGLYLIYGFTHWLQKSHGGKLHCLNFAFVDYLHCRVINPSEHSVLPRSNYIVSDKVWSGIGCATMLCRPQVQEAFMEAFYQSISWDIN